MSEYEKFIISWMFVGAIMFMILGKKPKENSLGKVGSCLFGMWLLPVLLFLFPILLYIDRKKLKWLKGLWFWIGTKRAIDFAFNWRGRDKNF